MRDLLCDIIAPKYGKMCVHNKMVIENLK